MGQLLQINNNTFYIVSNVKLGPWNEKLGISELKGQKDSLLVMSVHIRNEIVPIVIIIFYRKFSNLLKNFRLSF